MQLTVGILNLELDDLPLNVPGKYRAHYASPQL
jgi:hypothetical protein